MSKDSEAEEKKQFAALLLSEGDPFKAGLKLFPSNVPRALKIANEWKTDPDVIAEMAHLNDDNAPENKTSKAALSREIWHRMKGCTDDKDYVALARLFADINSMIEKPQPSTTINNIAQPRVMTVKDYGSDENWERKMRDQQKALQNGDYDSVTKH